jgi:hypothetical protein
MYLYRLPDRELTRAEERQIQKLERDHERVVAADRAWFDRHPGRVYRLRRMSAPEIRAREILGLPGSATLPPGYVLFVAIKRVTPGQRFRAFGAMPTHTSDDLPEEVCRYNFNGWSRGYPRLDELAERLSALHAQGVAP